MDTKVENGCLPLYHLPAHAFTQPFASDFTVPLPVALGMVISQWSCPSVTLRQLYGPHSCPRVSSPGVAHLALTVWCVFALCRLALFKDSQ